MIKSDRLYLKLILERPKEDLFSVTTNNLKLSNSTFIKDAECRD